MKQSPIKQKDIAEALNVSLGTVSRALKNSYMISDETKAKVQEYAKKHNYRPNLSAQFLKNQKTRSIGVSLSALNIGFYSDVLSGIESTAIENNYHIIISQCHESEIKERKNLEHLQWRGVDGLIISISSETFDYEVFKEIIDSGVPIVFFDRVPSGLNAHCVVSDNAGGSYTLTKALLDKGYTKIAHITSQPNLSITIERIEGYHKALIEKGMPIVPEYIQYCSHGGKDKAEIEDALNTLLNLPNPPEVIFTASDRITLSCFSILNRLGIKIPEEIAIAGFCNFEFPALLNPSLTTVSQQAFKMGETAMQLLIGQVEIKRKPTSFERIVIPTIVELRASI